MRSSRCRVTRGVLALILRFDARAEFAARSISADVTALLTD